MNIIFTHFWLICGLWCGFGGALYFRSRLKCNINESGFSLDEVNKFAKNYALWIFIPCLILWLLQMSSGFESDVNYLTWPTPQRIVALILQVIIWSALIYWVFFNDGAETLSKYLSAAHKYYNFIYSPLIIKLAVAIGVVGGVYALFNFEA